MGKCEPLFSALSGESKNRGSHRKNRKNTDTSLERIEFFCYTLYKSAKSKVELLQKLFDFADAPREYVRITVYKSNFCHHLYLHDAPREYVRITIIAPALISSAAFRCTT